VVQRTAFKRPLPSPPPNPNPTHLPARITPTQANYRAVIRAHKGALGALKAFWQLLLHSDVSMARLQASILGEGGWGSGGRGEWKGRLRVRRLSAALSHPNAVLPSTPPFLPSAALLPED
jgi:hypothetical protein